MISKTIIRSSANISHLQVYVIHFHKYGVLEIIVNMCNVSLFFNLFYAIMQSIIIYCIIFFMYVRMYAFLNSIIINFIPLTSFIVSE